MIKKGYDSRPTSDIVLFCSIFVYTDYIHVVGIFFININLLVSSFQGYRPLKCIRYRAVHHFHLVLLADIGAFSAEIHFKLHLNVPYTPALFCKIKQYPLSE